MAGGAARPVAQGPRGMERGGQGGEEISLGTSGGEGRTRPARHFDDTGGDLDELESKCGELGLGQVAGGGDGVADGEHQPVSGGVQSEAHLIGERRAA